MPQDRSDDPLAALPATVDPASLSGHVVLVGYGRVGRRIADALSEHRLPFVVAEQNRELVERLRELGIPAVSGDASEPGVLIQAHVARASLLVIATPQAEHSKGPARTGVDAGGGCVFLCLRTGH